MSGFSFKNIAVPVDLAYSTAASNNGLDAAIKIENCSNVSINGVICAVLGVKTLDIINSKVVIDELYPEEGVVTISDQSDVSLLAYYGTETGITPAVVGVDKSRLFVKEGIVAASTTLPTVSITDYADVLHKNSGGTYIKTFEGTFLVY